MKKSSIVRFGFLAVVFGAFSSGASAQTFVNFANPGEPVQLGGFFYLGDASPNYITSANPAELADSDLVNFNGSAAIDGGGTLGFSLSLYDDGMKTTIPELVSQMTFYVSNYSGQALSFEANELRIGVSGLYALGRTLGTTFNYAFVNGGESLGLVSHYDSATGSFYFTNTEAFQLPNSQLAMFGGTFSATPLPEPATWAQLLGGGALGLAVLRRRGVRRLTPGTL